MSPFNRRAFVVGIAACTFALTPVNATAKPAPPPRVLFICQFGSVKSAVAREHLRRRAAERGIALSVQSRGITPEDHVSPALTRALAEDRIDPRTEALRRLEPRDVTGANVVVLFDRPAMAGLDKARDWSSLPSMNADYPRARADLFRWIDALLDEISSRSN